MKSWLVGALVLLVGGLASGCYAHNQIPATELPRLNDMSSQASTSGNVTLITHTVQNVTRTDGTIVQIQGEFDATVVPRDPGAPTVTFGHPVQATTDGFNLSVAGGNRAATLFPLEAIDYIDISTYDLGLSMIWWIAGGLVLGGAAAGISLALVF